MSVSKADTALPDESLFVQYLSTGQFECARLAYLLLSERPGSKVQTQAKLVAAGYRPNDWAYSPSCPSLAHLSWLCARLLSNEDFAEFKNAIPRFTLAASALLVEAGITVEEAPVGKPSERVKRLAELLLSDNDRLSRLLCGPQFLATLVWADLQEFITSPTLMESILRAAVDALVEENRFSDAAALVAATKAIREVPDSLAEACGRDDRIAEEVLMSLLACTEDLNALAHHSVFRTRKSRSKEDDLGAMILTSLRTDQREKHHTWFTKLVDAPFLVPGSPDALKIVHLLTSVSGESEWCEQLIATQRALRWRDDAEVIGKEPMREGSELQQLLQNRVDRLGFAFVCAETLCHMSKDLRSARLAHELRVTSLPDLLLNKVPPFEIAAVERLGRDLIPGEGASPIERKQIATVRLAVWISDVLRGLSTPAQLQESANLLFLKSLGDDESRNNSVEFVVRKCIRLLTTTDRALEVVRILREVSNARCIIEAETRLFICDVLLEGDVRKALDSNARDLVIICLEYGEWDLALKLSTITGEVDLQLEAECGKAISNGEPPPFSLAQADVLVSQGHSVDLALLEEAEAQVQHAIIAKLKYWLESDSTSLSTSPTMPLGMDLPAISRKQKVGLPGRDSSLGDLQRWLEEHPPDAQDRNEGRHLEKFVQYLVDASGLLGMTPQSILNKCITESIVERVLACSDNAEDLLESFCDRWKLDPCEVLLEEHVRQEHVENNKYIALLKAIEKRISIGGFPSSSERSLLQALFLPNTLSPKETKDFALLRALDVQTDTSMQSESRPAAGSDYSLDDVIVHEGLNSSLTDKSKATGNIAEEDDWLSSHLLVLSNVRGNRDADHRKFVDFERALSKPDDFRIEFERLMRLKAARSITGFVLIAAALQLAAAAVGLRLELRTHDDGQEAALRSGLYEKLELDSKYDWIQPELAARILQELCDEVQVRHTWVRLLAQSLRDQAVPVGERSLLQSAADIIESNDYE